MAHDSQGLDQASWGLAWAPLGLAQASLGLAQAWGAQQKSERALKFKIEQIHEYFYF